MSYPASSRARAIPLGLLCCLVAACSSSPGPLPASVTAARTAQERLDRVEAGRIAGPQLTQLDRLIAMADVAWERGDARQAQFYAEEALATIRLMEALGTAEQARSERDAVHRTIVRLREEVGIGRDAVVPADGGAPAPQGEGRP